MPGRQVARLPLSKVVTAGMSLLVFSGFPFPHPGEFVAL